MEFENKEFRRQKRYERAKMLKKQKRREERYQYWISSGRFIVVLLAIVAVTIVAVLVLLER